MNRSIDSRIKKRVFKRTATPTFSPGFSEDKDSSPNTKRGDKRLVKRDSKMLVKSPDEVYTYRSYVSPIRKIFKKKSAKPRKKAEINYCYTSEFFDTSPVRELPPEFNDTFKIISRSHRRASADQTIGSVNETFTKMKIPCSSLNDTTDNFKENLPCVDSERFRENFSNIFAIDKKESKSNLSEGDEKNVRNTVKSEINLVDPISKKIKVKRISLSKDKLENGVVIKLDSNSDSVDKKSKKLQESMSNDSDSDIQFHIRRAICKNDFGDCNDNMHDKTSQKDPTRNVKKARKKYGSTFIANPGGINSGINVKSSSDSENETDVKSKSYKDRAMIRIKSKFVSDENDEVFQKPKPEKKSRMKRSSTLSRTYRRETDPSKFHSFIYSLSEEVDESQKKRHPEAVKYVKDFQKYKNVLAKKLFREFNKRIFNEKLPLTMEINWNKRLSTTAGYCKYTINKVTNAHKACIELSDKVCDSSHRLRDILLHEMCHAAVWILNKRKESHGPNWKGWAELSSSKYPEIPRVDVSHNYAIVKKFLYICMNCNYHISRHSKSINENALCKKCGVGDLKLEHNPAYSSIRKQKIRDSPAGLGPFALYLQQNYKTVRQQRGSHSDTMKALGEQFRKSKLSMR